MEQAPTRLLLRVAGALLNDRKFGSRQHRLPDALLEAKAGQRAAVRSDEVEGVDDIGAYGRDVRAAALRPLLCSAPVGRCSTPSPSAARSVRARPARADVESVRRQHVSGDRQQPWS